MSFIFIIHNLEPLRELTATNGSHECGCGQTLRQIQIAEISLNIYNILIII